MTRSRAGRGADRFQGGLGSDSINPDGGNDFIESGPDGVEDSIVGRLDAEGLVASNAKGQVLFGNFNEQDFFTLAGRNFGKRAQ
jgi:hypothetical protein